MGNHVILSFLFWYIDFQTQQNMTELNTVDIATAKVSNNEK